MFHSNYFVSLSLKSSRGGEDSWVLIISKAPCKGTQHCWMLHLASVCTPCCMLLDVVACCCAKFETSQTFQPTTPNIPFVPWSPKRSATMLKSYGSYLSDDELQVRQHSWELLHPFAHHCQHGHSNSQHCWPNNRLGVAASDCTWPLRVVTQSFTT